MTLLETSRLRVRPWATKDAGWFYGLSQDDGLTSNTIDGDVTRYRQASSEASAARIQEWNEYFERTGLGVWPVFHKETGVPVGLCGIKPIHPDGDAEPSWELMYRFATPWWGKGFATEVAQALLKYGFETRGLERITAGVVPGNEASVRVAEKIGMSLEREIRIQGRPARLYSCLRDQRKTYVLGTGDDELDRLALQHRLWADMATQSWKRARIAAGSRVLDLGSGPGHASYDLAQLVTGAGAVRAVDESPEFVAHVNAQAAARQLPQLSAIRGDAQDLASAGVGVGEFDAAYARWLLCWLPRPELAIQGMRRALKPGGRVVIHDYFNWGAMTMAPRSGAIDRMVKAALESFRARQGDVDIVARLPALLRASGFEIEHFEIHQRAARGGGADPMVHWPLNWWRVYGPKLEAAGRLSATDWAECARELDALERDPDRFFFCPPLFEIVARA